MQKKVRFTMEQMIKVMILILMFLCSIDIYNRHQICILGMCILFVADPKRKINFDYSFITLLLFSLMLLIFNATFNESLTDIIRAFNYPLCYLVGRSLFVSSVQTDLRTAEKNTRTIVYIVGIGTFIHYFLNMIVNWGRTERDGVEFWSGKLLSATGQATYACIAIALIAATLFSPNVGKTKKLMAVGALVVVILYNLVLSGRTLFVLIAVIMLLAYFFKSYMQKINIISTVLKLGVVVVILAVLYNANAFNVKTTFEESNFYNRFYGGRYTQDIEDDSRMEHKLYYIDHFGEHMFGGGHIREEYGHSAHDLYLDTYDESGIFATLFIIAYILASLFRCIKCIKNKNISIETKQLVLCIYAIVNIMFFMEPIMRGASWLLFSYCLIDGSVAYLLQNAKAMVKLGKKQGELYENC